jgi:hypothetical protein
MNWLYNLVNFETSSDEIFVFDEEDITSIT